MSYAFDDYGWYTGTPGSGTRKTSVAPSNVNTSSTPGALRSNWTGSAWTELAFSAPAVDNRTEARRFEVLKAVRAEASRRSAAGFLAAGSWWQNDSGSRLRQTIYFAAGASLPAGILWQTMSGSQVELTPSLVSTVFFAAIDQEQALAAKEMALITEVEGSPAPSLVAIYNDWPAIYGE